MSYEEFDERQYKEGPDGLWREAGPWGTPDEVLVIDAKRTAAGILGSNNTLGGRTKGVVGYVIDGTCRDSYECIVQKTPVFCTVRSPAHPMGRIGPVSDSKPITCAGAPVEPGDVIVADEDGVIVVPVESDARGAVPSRGAGEDRGRTRLQQVAPAGWRWRRRGEVRRFVAQKLRMGSGGNQIGQCGGGLAMPDDEQRIQVAPEPAVELRAGRKRTVSVSPQAHVDAELDLAVAIRDKRIGVVAQIDDAAARRNACPQVKARSPVKCSVARRPLDPAVGEHAVPLAGSDLQAGALPGRGMALQPHERRAGYASPHIGPAADREQLRSIRQELAILRHTSPRPEYSGISLLPWRVSP
jgi:hypothetical protein